MTSFKLMTESFREELENFKRDLKAEIQAMKHPVPIKDVQPNQPPHLRMDVAETPAEQSLVFSS